MKKSQVLRDLNIVPKTITIKKPLCYIDENELTKVIGRILSSSTLISFDNLVTFLKSISIGRREVPRDQIKEVYPPIPEGTLMLLKGGDIPGQRLCRYIEENDLGITMRAVYVTKENIYNLIDLEEIEAH